MKRLAVALLLAATGAAVQAQTFTHVETQGFGRYDQIVAVADFNRDGRDDLVLGGRHHEGGPWVAVDRLRKTRMRVLFGTRNGRFRPAPGGFVRGLRRAHTPIGVAADFNGDGRPDFAIFDAGVYLEWRGHWSGLGNPPQLYLSRGRRMVRSSALADAVRREHRKNPDPRYSGPADLHIKRATAGDIDNDGDLDLWVESSGGANVTSHFMVNGGNGTRFDVDTVRAPHELLHNPYPEYWRHNPGHLVDVDNDGDLDLALGQLRDPHPTHIHQSSIVLINDGTGHFPARVELPHPRFYRGFTAVQGIVDFDLNGDGLRDLLLSHTRNDDVSTEGEFEGDFTGRYIQALVNRGDGTFGDETRTWVKGQGATRAQRYPNGEPLFNQGDGLAVHDVDRDGCADLFMVDTWGPIRPQSPIAYRNNGRGQFRPMPVEPWRGGRDWWFGTGAWPADVNGDGLVDLVVPSWILGPDDRENTRDDFTLITTVLNTTRPRPSRCD